MSLSGLSQRFWYVAVMSCIFGVFEGSFHGQRATVLSEMVHEHLLATSVGYMTFFQGVGNFIGPLWAGQCFALHAILTIVRYDALQVCY